MPTRKTSVHLTGLDIILVSDLQHKMVVVMVIVSTQIDGITGSLELVVILVTQCIGCILISLVS